VSQNGMQRIADFVLAPAELDSLEEFVERAKAFSPARDGRLVRRSLVHNLRQLPKGRWSSQYDRRYLRGDLVKIRAGLPSLTERLPSITCPGLVVRGAESDVLSEAEPSASPKPSKQPQRDHPKRGPHRARRQVGGLAHALKQFLAAAA
jgi:pimeloyl-ACP methyl ester carboxylesterase